MSTRKPVWQEQNEQKREEEEEPERERPGHAGLTGHREGLFRPPSKTGFLEGAQDRLWFHWDATAVCRGDPVRQQGWGKEMVEIHLQ